MLSIGRKAGKEGVQCGHGNKEAGLPTTRQGVKLRELSSRQKIMRGSSFARTWRERMRRAICLEWPSKW